MIRSQEVLDKLDHVTEQLDLLNKQIEQITQKNHNLVRQVLRANSRLNMENLQLKFGALEKAKQENKKYTIKVLGDNDKAFLNLKTFDYSVTFNDDWDTPSMKTHFTKQEIEQLKQRNDIAIDWDKAIIEEVPADED